MPVHMFTDLGATKGHGSGQWLKPALPHTDIFVQVVLRRMSHYFY